MSTASLNRKLIAQTIDQELNLPPPGADVDHLEEDDSDDEDRYELWTIRVPSNMMVSDLEGVEISMDALSSKDGMKINEGKFSVSLGDGVENDNLRVLVPSNVKNNNDDDEGDGNSSSTNNNSDDESDEMDSGENMTKFLLHPSSKAFSRHLNIHPNLMVKKTEAQLAPLKGPDPVDDVLRRAYSHIPQRKGLKRRWMPLGAPQSAQDVPEALITLQPKKDDEPAAILSDNELLDVGEPKPKASRKRSNSHGNNRTKQDRSSGKTKIEEEPSTPKKKRIKKENGSDKKASKKSAKKSKKRKSV